MEETIIRFVKYKGERFEILLCEEGAKLFDAHQWYLSKSDNHLYLKRCAIGNHGKGIYFHRELMGFPSTMVDHRNRNRLDCRKSNLRVATSAQNTYNRAIKITNKSGRVGVFENKRLKSKPWEAFVGFKYKRYFCGRFATRDEASVARDKMALKLHKEFAALNSELAEAA